MHPQAERFVTAAQEASGVCHEVIEALEGLFSVYFDRGYNSGGSDPITDTDLESFGFTAAQLASLMNLAEQMVNFRDNAAVTQSDWGSVLNQVRRV